MYTVIIGSLLLPIIEVLLFGSIAFGLVSYPPTFGGAALQRIPSLGLHPILGLMAGVLVAYYYVKGYSNYLYTLVVGGAFTIVWFFLGLTLENRGRDVGAVLSELFSASYWSRLGTSPDGPAWLLALWLALVSVAWRVAFRAWLGGASKVESMPLLSLQSLKQRLRSLAILAAVSAVSFILLKACGSSGGLGR